MLWHMAPPPDRVIVWTSGSSECRPGYRRGMADRAWRIGPGADCRLRGADRSRLGAGAATLKATVPSYPSLQRGDVVVVGGIATVRRGWWPDADGSLYGQWMRVEQSGDGSTLDDARHRIVARFIAGIDRFVRTPESGLATGMLLGEKTAIDRGDVGCPECDGHDPACRDIRLESRHRHRPLRGARQASHRSRAGSSGLWRRSGRWRSTPSRWVRNSPSSARR